MGFQIHITSMICLVTHICTHAQISTQIVYKPKFGSLSIKMSKLLRRYCLVTHIFVLIYKCLSVLVALCRRTYVLAHYGNTRVRVPVLLIGLTLIISIIWLYHWFTWVTFVYGCTRRTKQYIRPRCNGRQCLCMTSTDNTWANCCVTIDHRGRRQIFDESHRCRSRTTLWLR